jgi:hypothetical protein
VGFGDKSRGVSCSSTHRLELLGRSCIPDGALVFAHSSDLSVSAFCERAGRLVTQVTGVRQDATKYGQGEPRHLDDDVGGTVRGTRHGKYRKELESMP